MMDADDWREFFEAMQRVSAWADEHSEQIAEDIERLYDAFVREGLLPPDPPPVFIHDPTLPAKFSITGPCPKCGEPVQVDGIMPDESAFHSVETTCATCGTRVIGDVHQESPKRS